MQADERAGVGARMREKASRRPRHRGDAPVRNPRPSGEYASTLTPSSLHASRTPFFSMVSSHGEYSTSTKSTVATFAARRSVSAEHSERPMNLVLPSLRTASSARTVSSIGLSGGGRAGRTRSVRDASGRDNA